MTPWPLQQGQDFNFCEMQHTGNIFSLCRRSVHKKSQQNKNPKNTTNQSKGFKTASFQDRCCSFQEQSKSFIIKKQGKKKITKPNAKSNVQVWNSEDESRDRSRPRFRLKHRTQNALWKNSCHCKSHLQLRRVFVYLYKNTPAPPETAWGSSSRVPKPRWSQPLGGTGPPAPTPQSPTGAPGAVTAVGTAAARSVLSVASERMQKCWLSEYPPKVLEVLSLKRFFPQCQVYKCVSF